MDDSMRSVLRSQELQFPTNHDSFQMVRTRRNFTDFSGVLPPSSFAGSGKPSWSWCCWSFLIKSFLEETTTEFWNEINCSERKTNNAIFPLVPTEIGKTGVTRKKSSSRFWSQPQWSSIVPDVCWQQGMPLGSSRAFDLRRVTVNFGRIVGPLAIAQPPAAFSAGFLDDIRQNFLQRTEM